MFLPRRTPHVVIALFALRVLACGNSSSTGNGGAMIAGNNNPGGTIALGDGGHGGGSGGNGAPAGDGGIPKGVCNGKVITYQALLSNGSLETRTHTCPSDCSYRYDGHPICSYVDGQAPFWTCTSNDYSGGCYPTNYCLFASSTQRVILDSPTCVESACDWKSKTTADCPGSAFCSSAQCAYNSTGVTSGGFPWMNNGTGGIPNAESDAGSD
jgi:hypothetical protein